MSSTVYAKTYNFNGKNGNDVHLRKIAHTCVCIMQVHAIVILYCIRPYNYSLHHTLPRIFLVFEYLFLKASRTVLFHTTATHCHNGRDIEDASVFVLE